MSTRDRRVDRASPFQIDANLVNARGGLPNINKLEQWHSDGVVNITMSDVAQSEAAIGNAARARKAFYFIRCGKGGQGYRPCVFISRDHRRQSSWTEYPRPSTLGSVATTPEARYRVSTNESGA